MQKKESNVDNGHRQMLILPNTSNFTGWCLLNWGGGGGGGAGHPGPLAMPWHGHDGTGPI